MSRRVAASPDGAEPRGTAFDGVGDTAAPEVDDGATPAPWSARLRRRFGDASASAGATLLSTFRLALGGVLAYLLTVEFVPGPIDLTGALTALLVLQASAVSSVRMGIVRVGAVLTGVLVAVVLTSWVGLTWWSLGTAIAASLLLAAVLHLREQALETPISAMLVLAVGGQEIAAETRIVTTFIGAGVGVGLSLLLPPRVPTRAAVAAVHRVAREAADSLRLAGASVAERPIVRADVARWAEQARAVDEAAGRAAELVRAVGDVRRLNARAIVTADAQPVLEWGLDALGASLLAVRSLFRVVQTEAPAVSTPDDGYGEEVRAAFAVVLEDLADSVGAFGALVEAEASGSPETVEQRLAESLEAAREARAILTELLLVDARTETSLWLLRGSILVAVEHVLAPLDVERRARLRHGRLSGAAPAQSLVRAMIPRSRARRVRALARRGVRVLRSRG
ncbi:aromatic acid exporter family protein [Kineococcus rubinsiae]|uniref:aromatic acid exporter family protein n=1 Tax=Kineococcus rubinsiae TaxID=2609562 RepID=UPI00143159A7|nr:aromatic acid exporter family protein [Kineococcus rubinsiae]NIZ89524.1 FUSC family protein [Kineococcus rubinsiae]